MKTPNLDLISEVIIGEHAYDELSDYGRGIRAMLNLFDELEAITEEDILNEVKRLQEREKLK